MVLRYLLRYKGWMFEGRGQVSLFTRVWAGLLSIFSKGLSGFYAFQDHCPPLPVPRLDDTIQRYLTSMKELLTEAEFAKLKVLFKKIFQINDIPRKTRNIFYKR